MQIRRKYPAWALVRYGALLALLLSACDRAELLGVLADGGGASLGGVSGTTSVFGGRDAGAGGEDASAGLGGRAGAATGPFAPPTPVSVLSDPSGRDTDPSLTADALHVFFMSERTGSKDIWYSTRASRSLPWRSPTPVTELNSDVGDENPCVGYDGLTIWFYTDRDRPRGTLWRATRGSLADRWNAPQPVPELNTGGSDVAMGVDESGTLAVVSRIRTAQQYDLYGTERSGADGPFSALVPLAVVNSDRNDFDPVLGNGGLFLGFHSERGRSSDIYIATRQRTDLDFGVPLAVAELNTDSQEHHPTFSVELDYVMFSSDRDGNMDIYESHRTR